MHRTVRRRTVAAVVLAAALAVSCAGAAFAAPMVEPPGSLVVRVLDWLAHLHGWQDPGRIGSASPDAMAPASDPDSAAPSPPLPLQDSNQQTSSPVDDGSEAGPYIDPNG